MSFVTVWDGKEFHQVSEKEAEKLEKEDKVQVIRTGFVDGTWYKTRAQFTGYNTREMRAAPPAAPSPPKKVDPPPSAPEPDVDLHDMTVMELRDYAKSKGLEGFTALKKDALIDFIEENA